ncbi:MAG: hypothetical protein NVS2B16_18910 [Chloroflexota bacterium]
MPRMVREYPVFAAAAMRLTVHQRSYSFVALDIPRIAAHKKVHLFLRFSSPMHPRSLVVATSPAIHAADWHVLDNPDCIIRPVRG